MRSCLTVNGRPDQAKSAELISTKVGITNSGPTDGAAALNRPRTRRMTRNRAGHSTVIWSVLKVRQGHEAMFALPAIWLLPLARKFASAAWVAAFIVPVWGKPASRWRKVIAAIVWGPMRPSIEPL
jgi:hypothetical protein